MSLMQKQPVRVLKSYYFKAKLNRLCNLSHESKVILELSAGKVGFTDKKCYF